ncbi:MAG TPA: hypothetical protein VM639_09065 [Dongiaceae bacterium]|nr:hypothetical protein [Dongiaceae bacterium]
MKTPNWIAAGNRRISGSGAIGRAATVSLALMLSLPALSAASFADTAPPKRIRGTIDAISDSSLDVTSRGGQKMTFKLAPDLAVTGVTRTTLSEIKPGSYIGTAALPQADGSLKAMEVHIFPPSMKGTGEGERPWDQGKSSKMLNGLVGDVVGTDGHSFMVKYGDKQQKVDVPDKAPVVMMAPADRSLLKPGAKVIVFAAPTDPQTAARVLVGENGLTPPM